jgi:plastocyanin
MTTIPTAAAGTQSGHSPVPIVPARIAGAALLVATAGIHLDLYLTGYREIPTIGWMFLLQVVVAFILGLAVLAFGGPVGARRLVAASGAVFAVATLGGYLLSVWVGLFGFKELRTTAGIAAAIVEIAAFLVLGALAGARLPSPGRWAAVPLSAVAIVVLIVTEITATGAAVSAPRHSASPAGGTKGSLHIVIKNFTFTPDHAAAKAGERIVVTNEDPVTHTFTATGTATGKFNSGAIVPGQSRTVIAPSAAGSYPFFCMIHQYMTGVLTVSGSATS